MRGIPPKILIVDDNPENRAVFRNMLSPLGAELSEAGDGRDSFRNWYKNNEL
ncbi:response regulator domain-containing protein [Desulfonema magnum]|uniref:Response regulator domain-containing protein n=2 Tax=Desulfonema magnum TaxID=45655 RepID=A0A975BQP5_9BACT|nr:response regulator domain-containing protein [Desulfonema magnum]